MLKGSLLSTHLTYSHFMMFNQDKLNWRIVQPCEQTAVYSITCSRKHSGRINKKNCCILVVAWTRIIPIQDVASTFVEIFWYSQVPIFSSFFLFCWLMVSISADRSFRSCSLNFCLICKGYSFHYMILSRCGWHSLISVFSTCWWGWSRLS